MVVLYRETPEDRELAEQYRICNGQKIDIRWSGGWLTPEGTCHSVDYANKITHEKIAIEYGSAILGSGSITSRPPIMRIFDIAKWIRITYSEGSAFGVELKGTLVGKAWSSSKNEEELYAYNHRRQSVLLRFVRDFDNFDNYFINNTRHQSYREFLAAIRNNDVHPAKGR